MSERIEFDIPEELKSKGILEIAKEANTIVVNYKGTPIRFDIDKNSWQQTTSNFEEKSKGWIDQYPELIQHIIVCLSNNWLKIIENESKCSSFNTSKNNEHQESFVDINKLNQVIENRDYREFIIETIKKEVKQEDILIRQVFDTAVSAYSIDPLNLGIMAPTSEGKTYAVEKTIQYFPKQDILFIGSMSPKFLIRQKGTRLDKNTNLSIEEKIRDIQKQIKKTKNSNERTSLEEELEKIIENSKIVIDLNNIILVFLEPPHKELWSILKPILSHDREEIEYPFVEKTDKDGTHTKNVVVRGFPACIFCSAKDESGWSMWPEIQSRFSITSPNMKSEKYKESNLLIAKKKGLPTLVQEHIIVSKKDQELAKKCVRYLKQELLKIKENQANSNPVWIPFGQILVSALEANKGADVRVVKRIFSLLNVVPLTRSHLRPKLVYGKETLVVCALEDLVEVLNMTQNLKGIPPHKMDFFKRILIPTYLAKTEPDKHESNGKQEKIIAVTSRQLSDKLKEVDGKIMRTDALKTAYLDELLNNGLIDQLPSEIDGRQNIFFPIVDPSEYQDYNQKIKKLSNSDNLDNKLQFSKLKPPKNFKKFDINWLKMEILALKNYPIEPANFSLLDKNGKENCEDQFIRDYEENIKLDDFFSLNEIKKEYQLTQDKKSSVQYLNLDGYNENSKTYNNLYKNLENMQNLDNIGDKSYKKLSISPKMDKNVIFEESERHKERRDYDTIDKFQYNKQCPFCKTEISKEIDMEIHLAGYHRYEIINQSNIAGDLDYRIDVILNQLKSGEYVS